MEETGKDLTYASDQGSGNSETMFMIKFSGPEGKVRPQNTPVQSEGYINIAGSLEKPDEPSGIVIVDHPQNPDYPQDWILRNKHSMQNAVFPGQESYPVSATESLELKYSLIIYSEDPTTKTIMQWVRKTRPSTTD